MLSDTATDGQPAEIKSRQITRGPHNNPHRLVCMNSLVRLGDVDIEPLKVLAHHPKGFFVDDVV